MRLTDEQLEALRELRAERGTAELAEELGIPAASFRRILSTGNTGCVDVVGALLEEAEEYEGDEDDEELAELWGVGAEDVEALRDTIGEFEVGSFTQAELRAYIDDLYDALTEEGWDLDVSDLWDMYYGYTPGAR